MCLLLQLPRSNKHGNSTVLPLTLGLIADPGQTYNTTQTLENLRVAAPDAVILVGDFCYAGELPALSLFLSSAAVHGRFACSCAALCVVTHPAACMSALMHTNMDMGGQEVGLILRLHCIHQAMMQHPVFTPSAQPRHTRVCNPPFRSVTYLQKIHQGVETSPCTNGQAYRVHAICVLLTWV